MDFKTVLKVEIRCTVHDLWYSREQIIGNTLQEKNYFDNFIQFQ